MNGICDLNKHIHWMNAWQFTYVCYINKNRHQHQYKNIYIYKYIYHVLHFSTDIQSISKNLRILNKIWDDFHSSNYTFLKIALLYCWYKMQFFSRVPSIDSIWFLSVNMDFPVLSLLWSQYVCYTFLLTEFSSFVIQSHQTIQYESWEGYFLQRDWNCFLLNCTTNSATTCHSEMLKRKIRNAILELYI